TCSTSEKTTTSVLSSGTLVGTYPVLIDASPLRSYTAQTSAIPRSDRLARLFRNGDTNIACRSYLYITDVVASIWEFAMKPWKYGVALMAVTMALATAAISEAQSNHWNRTGPEGVWGIHSAVAADGSFYVLGVLFGTGESSLSKFTQSGA